MRPRQIVTAVLVLVLTVAAFFGTRLVGERDARLNSEYRAQVAAAQIRGRVEQGSFLAESLAQFMLSVAGSRDAGEEFESNASRWLSPAGFPAAAWVEQVPAALRAAYGRRTGLPIVTVGQQLRIVPAGPRSWFLPATLVSGVSPFDVPGIDLSGENGMAAAVTRARELDAVSATPLAILPDGEQGLLLTQSAPSPIGGAGMPAFVVLFVSAPSLQAAATYSAPVQLAVGGTTTGDLGGGAAVRSSFMEAGQRFDVAVPLESVSGAAAVLPWVILAVGLVFAGLASALGVNAARRARAQRELDRIFNLSSDLIVIADFEGHFRRVNPAVERILGYTPAEFLGRDYLQLVHPDDREKSRAEIARIRQGANVTSFENRYVRSDGSYRVLEWTATPVLDEKLMYGVARDVTERRRAESELRRLTGELAASRRRIVSAADDARRRIERNLHDGTQQRLVSLKLSLDAAEAHVPQDRDDLQAELSHVASGLTDAVRELQEISRGIHPAILSQGGLGPALRTLVRRSVIPVQLDVATSTRMPEPAEVAAYYVASEALANSAKHARASRMEVSLATRDGSLVLAIRDDGVGGADAGLGSGLVGLQDRIEALGGTFRIHSPPGGGTSIVVTLPLDAGSMGATVPGQRDVR